MRCDFSVFCCFFNFSETCYNAFVCGFSVGFSVGFLDASYNAFVRDFSVVFRYMLRVEFLHDHAEHELTQSRCQR